MKNIHILPTDKPSRLYLGNNGNFVFGMIQTSIQSRNDDFTNQNIYITNDEEIKEGDWIFDLDVKKVVKADNLKVTTSKKYQCWYYKKIILTTDQDLIKELEQIDQNYPITKGSTALVYKQNVQSIPDEFLEWFVNNPSCDEIEVKMNQGRYFDYGGNVHITNAYKIIIPKQEPKKVLTEEDIFNQKDIDAVTDYINKEQQKQHLIDMMESDEELGLYDETIDSIKLEEVFGSKHCLYSVIENKLAILYRNQEKILSAIKILNNGRK